MADVVVSCTLFGAVSGSTQATVVAVGSPLRPRMLESGYKDSFTLALIINASDIAFLIPPSIGMIIYGVISGTSIAELFIAASVATHDGEGVTVTRSSCNKCGRCWRLLPSVAEDGDLCSRCEEVVN